MRSARMVLASVALAVSMQCGGAQGAGPLLPVFEARWQTYDGDRGLPQNSVTALALDDHGYLWIGTFGGLVRHDGHAFRTFPSRAADGPPSDRISALWRDPRGRIWIGTESAGLARHDPLRGFERPPQRCSEVCRISQIVGMGDGRILVAGDDGVHLVDEQWRSTPVPAPGLANPYTAAADADGRIWVADADAVLAPGAGTPIPLPGGAEVRRLLGFGGRVWASGSRLVRLDPRPDGASIAAALDIPVAYSASPGRDGEWWIGTLSAGMFRLDPSFAVATPYPVDAAVLRKTVALVEPGGTLWVGTDGGGLLRKPVAQVGAIGGPGSALGGSTAALLDGPGDRLWVAPLCGGLHAIDATGRMFRIALPGAGPGCVWSLAADADGGLLVSFENGTIIDLAEDGAVRRIRGIDGETRLRVLHRDGDGQLWVGGSRGLYRALDDGGFERQAGYGRAEVATIIDARDGGIWVGGKAGVVRWHDGGAAETVGPADGLPDRFVRALHEDADGVLWIGIYGGGLVRYAQGRLRAYTTDDGLAEDFVSCITEDAEGHLWLSGNRGLSRVDKRAFDVGSRRPSVVLYTRADGLPASETNGGGGANCVRDREGRWLVTTISGVGVVDPARIAAPALQPGPRVEVLDVRVDGAAVADGNTIHIPAARSVVTLRYTAPALEGADRLQFRYRLGGVWTEVGGAREIVLTEVPFGTHPIELAARIDAGPWSDNPTTLSIERRAPWFRRTEVLAAALVGMLAGLWALFRLRTRALRERASVLDRLVAERTAQLRAANAELVRLADADPLTGLANRRAFDRALRSRWEAWVTDGVPLALVVIDVDAFKAYNDACGHPAGDTVLRRLAVCVSDATRADAGVAGAADVLVARLGGEEFAVLLTAGVAARAGDIAERIRVAVAALGIAHPDSPVAPVVTISLGVAVATCAQADTDALVAAADAALYRAKREGRNRSVAIIDG